MGDKKDIVRWALTLARFVGKYTDGHHYGAERDMLRIVTEMLGEMETALGIATAPKPDAEDIDFHTLKPVNEVAS